MSDIYKMLVVQVFADTVATPGAAAHAQCKRQAGIKAAAIAKSMRLIDQHPHNFQIFSQFSGMLKRFSMDATGMPATFIIQHLMEFTFRPG